MQKHSIIFLLAGTLISNSCGANFDNYLSTKSEWRDVLLYKCYVVHDKEYTSSYENSSYSMHESEYDAASIDDRKENMQLDSIDHSAGPPPLNHMQISQYENDESHIKSSNMPQFSDLIETHNSPDPYLNKYVLDLHNDALLPDLNSYSLCTQYINNMTVPDSNKDSIAITSETSDKLIPTTCNNISLPNCTKHDLAQPTISQHYPESVSITGNMYKITNMQTQHIPINKTVEHIINQHVNHTTHSQISKQSLDTLSMKLTQYNVAYNNTSNNYGLHTSHQAHAIQDKNHIQNINVRIPLEPNAYSEFIPQIIVNCSNVSDTTSLHKNAGNLSVAKTSANNHLTTPLHKYVKSQTSQIKNQLCNNQSISNASENNLQTDNKNITISSSTKYSGYEIALLFFMISGIMYYSYETLYLRKGYKTRRISL